MTEQIETVIIGAGQAGLAMCYHLGRLGREHAVLERNRVAERWRSERWDSLFFQFPSWMMRLPGYAYEGSEPDGFMHRDGVVRFIEDYARRIAAPVRCGVRVTRLGQGTGSSLLAVETDGGTIEAANVVVATGPYQEPSRPSFAVDLSKAVYQTTANRYSNPDGLPAGGVIVVGSGASGYQIADDLLKSGRRVYLSVRRHRRVPRRYRGKDFGWWQEATGMLDRTTDSLPSNFHPPLLTGANGGKDSDLRVLESEGATLVGSLLRVDGNRLHFAADLEANLLEGDNGIVEFKRSVDEFIAEQGIQAPRDPPATPLARPLVPQILDLDVRAAGITSVIWATGYRNDFRWIDCPVFDDGGKPRHRRGITQVPGLYFLGLPRLHKVKSSFLWGSGDDASYLAQHIAART